jgi:tetrahydromethanopterin S-methyltransferase subunit G
MESVFLGLVNALSANPAMLLLCVVLIGGGWLVWKIGGRIVEGTFQRLDKFDSRLESIEDKLGEIVAVKKDLEKVEERMDRLEAMCDRRHK